MAIESTYFSLLSQVLQRLRGMNRTAVHALFLSYPDLLLNKNDLLSHFTEDDLAAFPVRPDSAEIWSWHGLAGNQSPIYDSIAVFERLGIRSKIGRAHV